MKTGKVTLLKNVRGGKALLGKPALNASLRIRT